MKKVAVLIFIGILTIFAGTVLAQSAGEWLAKGDEAFSKFNNEQALEFYQKALQADPDNYEAAWKLSRAYVDVGENIPDKDKRAQYYRKAEEFARKAVEIDSMGSKAHLYLSIALGRVALDAGKKEQVRLSKEIKAEVDKALALDPNDDIALHVLGRWNRKMATLGWVQRKFADMFLGGVPKDASLENAEKCFRKAIEINPGHINHHLELALTLEKMDRKQEALEIYRKILEMPNKDADDEHHKEEAKKRLKKLE